MLSIKKIERNLKRIHKNINPIVKRAVERHLDELEDIQAAQMQEGLNSDGSTIGRLRSTTYARFKKAKGGTAPFEAVDLRNTGSFQNKIKAKVIHGGIHLDSTDKKKTELIEKYGVNIFGFNDESKVFIKRIIVPSLIFETKRELRS